MNRISPETYSLLPTPQSCTFDAGTLQLTDRDSYQFPPEAEFAATELRRAVAGPVATGQPAAAVQFQPDDSLAPEAYVIDLETGRLLIRASSGTGYLYAVQTLRQLLAQQDGNRLPTGRIEDCPHFQWRGFMLDSARNFQSVERIKLCLDWLAAIKINRFHWHLVDTQAWRLEIRRYPRLTEVGSVRGEGTEVEGGFYSRDDIRAIVAYAAERGITIIPEIEMPAHSNAIIYCYPELSCQGTPLGNREIAQGHYHFTGQTDDVRNLCAGKELVFEMLDHILEETAALFPGPWLHVGGDERVRDLWSKCPHCRQRMAEEELPDEIMLQLYFMNRICRKVHKLGKTPIMWAENPERGIPDYAIVQGWRGPETKLAAAAGRPVICSDNPYFYLDYYPYAHMQGIEWLPEMNLRKVYEYRPEPTLAPEELPQLLGTEAPLWTSWVESYEIDQYMFPRLLAVAENQWQPPETPHDYDRFKAKTDRLEPYFNSLGIHYAKPLSERPFQSVIPQAVIDTNLKHYPGFPPEKALTPSRYCYSWSAEKPAAASYFAIFWPEARPAATLVLRFGKTEETYGVPYGAAIEASRDGENFVRVGTVNARRAECSLPGHDWRAIRLRFPAELAEELVIREVVLR